MDGHITSFILGTALGVLVTTALAFPRVGRIIVRVFAAAAMAVGAGMLTWSLYGILGGVSLQGIRIGTVTVSQPQEALAWSAGLLVAGIVSLVLSFIGGRAVRNDHAGSR